MKGLFRSRRLLALLAALLLLRYGYLYYKVGHELSRNIWEVPSILYGRSAAVRAGDDLDALRLEERLRRLGYRKVEGDPKSPGSWSEEDGTLRIHTRGFRVADRETLPVQAAAVVVDRRIVSLSDDSGSSLESLRLEPEEVTRILGPGMESRRLVSLEAIPKALQDAVLAAEDSRFYSHFGLDFPGILRALGTNLRRMRIVQGGSTITQQLAKNYFLTPKRTLWRKIREAELAILLEIRFDKREILEAYLNKIYFGQEGPRGIYGVEEAARFYFSKSVGALTLEESALLAGVIRSPNRYSPFRFPKAARERRNWVLGRMKALRMIPEEQARRAGATFVRTVPRSLPPRLAEYFVDYVERAAEESFGGRFSRTGFRIYTSLDPVYQKAAEEAVSRGLPGIAPPAGGAAGGGGPADPLQAALVAIDPRTGEITAMVGGRSYGESQFNRAADARRQPGSAFKPFVLLAAMIDAVEGKGEITLASRLSGEPISLPVKDGTWEPSNFEDRTYGMVTVRRMVEESVNTAAVRMALEVGLPRVVEAARRAGISSPLSPVPSIALGSFEVTPLELANAYATLASGGVRHLPRALEAVVGADGDELPVGTSIREEEVDPRAAFLVTSALQGVMDRGTGRSARDEGILFPVAGKTGTTDGYRDSWFVGYTPELVCAVWVGHDSGRDTGLTGASGALRIWSRFLRSIAPGGTSPPFPVPAGVTIAEIDPESGFLATSACPDPVPEAFPDRLAPTEPCPLHPAHPLVDTVRKGVRGILEFFRGLFR
ncbi:MAG TPA: PBP1A family penicillin-binding protein [Candidatus Deferrimicrobiaceae bacterium]